MLVLEAAVVLGVAALVVYALLRAAMRPADPSTLPSQWHVEHYDSRGATRVVVRRRSSGGRTILDEHPIATIAVDDPDYDEKFMTAMASARQRRAVFEAEDD